MLPPNIEKIITTDYENNHQGREYSPETAIKSFMAYLATGGKSSLIGNVIILYKKAGEKALEFHCINGGSAEDLVSSLQEFLLEMSKSFASAITYYDNPAINKLAVHSHFPATVHRVDQGRDKTYAMLFNLRG